MGWAVPFVDLRSQYGSIRDEIDGAIARVLETGQFVLGEEVSAFEQEFAAHAGTRHGIAVNSGTSALHLALLAAGVGPGDEVITVPFTFVATVAAIGYTGAVPVLVDVEPRSLTMDVERLPKAITPRTKAILPVHLYGQSADIDSIITIARRAGVLVIEDAAQAHGAEYRGRRVGGLGDLGCFSFYPSKNLGAFGEGGIVVTNNDGYARTIRLLRDWGQDGKYRHVMKGFNYRMDGLQGAILRVKLRHLDDWIERRRECAGRYDTLLKDSHVETPTELPYGRHAYYVYTVRSAQRDALQAHLAARGIQTAIHYPVPVHLQPGYHDLGAKEGDFRVSEASARTVLSLPMYPELTADQIRDVASAIRGFPPGGSPGR